VKQVERRIKEMNALLFPEESGRMEFCAFHSRDILDSSARNNDERGRIKVEVNFFPGTQSFYFVMTFIIDHHAYHYSRSRVSRI